MSHDARRKRMVALLQEKASREMSALRLYRPLPEQDPFHKSRARYRVVRGGNRSGKSASAFIETASCATGIAIHDSQGNPIPYRYPTNDPSHPPLIIWTVGFGESHVADTIHRMLFTEAHGFYRIQDEHTGLWRAYQPWNEYDVANKDKRRPMPPLIPPRMMDTSKTRDGFAWDNKGKGLFYSAHLINGTTIRGMTSRAEPEQGVPVDLIHIDEDIERPQDVSEWMGRLPDRDGCFIWSAFPHSANQALLDLSESAAKQKGSPNPNTEEIVLAFSRNPFIPKSAKEDLVEKWSEQGVLKARDEGMFQRDDVLMYPEFSIDVHGTPKKDPRDDDEVDKVLRETGGEIPDDWTRYMWVDPGHTQAAVLFLAIPPPEFGDFIVAYDEMYPKHLVGERLAHAILPRVQGKCFEAWGIDWRAGRQSQLGTPMRVVEAYRQAFEKLGIESRRTGFGFLKGNDNIPHRIQRTREWLMPRSDGTAKFKIVPERTPKFQREMKLYKKRVVKDESLDAPVDKDNHLMSCFQYAAAANHQYVKPVRTRSQWSPAYREFQKLKKQAEARNPSGGTVSFGPASGEMSNVF